MELTVGERLRIARTGIGLSQRKLAIKAGVNNSTISLIESDRINPSVSALKRILDSIQMPLSTFFSLGLSTGDQMVFKASELTEIGRGNISFRQIGKNLSKKSLQLLHETYMPGADTGSIMLQHEGEEAGFVISGQLELTIGSTKYNLSSGDAYYFKSTEPHRFRNVSRKPVVVVSACSPPSF